MSTSNRIPEQTDPFAHLAALRRWRRRLLLGCFLGALVCGTFGFRQYQVILGEETNWPNAIYHALQLFALHAPHFEKPVPPLLEIGRWLAAVATVLTVYGAGRRLFREEIEEWKCERLKGHVVVCGLGRKGLEEVKRHRAQGRTVAVLDQAPDDGAIEQCRRLGAHLLIGDATRPELLREARVDQAGLVVSLLADDSANCEVASQVANVCARAASAPSGQPLECRVQLSDAELRQALQESLAGGQCAGRVRFRFMDVFDAAARRLLVHDLPMDHDGLRPDDPREAHLVILGMGRMGRRLAVRAAQLGQFANRKPVRLTVIDRKADAHRDALLFRHPRIEQVCPFAFHTLDVFSSKGRELLQRLCSEPARLTSLIVAFEE